MLPDRENLSKLYPRPLSYIEREARRREYEKASAPRLVSVRIGLWITIAVLIVYESVSLAILFMKSGIESEGPGLITGVLLSVLVCMLAFVVLMYFRSKVSKLAYRVLLYGQILNITLVLISVGVWAGMYFAGAFGVSSFVATPTAGVVCFLLSTLAAGVAVQSQVESD